MRTLLLMLTASLVVLAPAAAELPDTGIIVSDNVRVRSEPELSGKVLARLNHGTVVSVEGKSENSEALSENGEKNWWYQIDSGDGQVGWVYGGFLFFKNSELYPGQEQDDLSFKGQTAQGTTLFTVSIYTDNPDQGDEEPVYDNHSILVVTDDQDDTVFFVHVSGSMADDLRSVRSEDGWYTMVSGMGGEQHPVSIAAMPNNRALLKVREQSNGGTVFEMSLQCFINPRSKLFEVEKASAEKITD